MAGPGEFRAVDEQSLSLSDTQSRYERGIAKLREIDGKAGEHVVESLKDISPDLARCIIEFPFGDVYTRPGLDLRAREIATVAVAEQRRNGPQKALTVRCGL